PAGSGRQRRIVAVPYSAGAAGRPLNQPLSKAFSRDPISRDHPSTGRKRRLRLSAGFAKAVSHSLRDLLGWVQASRAVPMTIKNENCSGPLHRIPPDLRKAVVAQATTRAAWKSLTPLARNEWICWVISAKQRMT